MLRAATTFALALALSACASGSGTDRRGGDAGLDAGAHDDVDASLIDSGSASDSGSAPDSDSASDSGAASDSGLMCGALWPCGGRCVDVQSDEAHCGACGRACSLAHATPECVSGGCEVGGCTSGWLDCNDAASDGCEREDTCSAGTACRTSCGSTGATSCADRCAPACTPPVELCNFADDDCDGACDDGATSCRVGVHRSYHDTNGDHFYTTDRAEAVCCGYRVENYDFFRLYGSAFPGLVALYRCLLPDHHFYTTSAACEGAAGAVNEGVLGWLSPDTRCGARPLFRLAGDGDHFYTVDAAERDYAVSLGFVSEGIAGYVW